MDKILYSTIGRHYHKKWFFSGETGNEDTIVPFELINKWIVVTVKLDGQTNKEYKFIFDTGAITMVEPEVMKELNLTPLMDFTTTDLNGVKRPVSLINIKKMTLGNRTFTKVGALSASAQNNLFKCYGIDGIFGYNLLERAVFRLNFAENILTISRQLNINRKDDFNSAKLTTDWRRVMYLELETRDRKVKAVLDTGAPNYILLNKSLQTDFDNSHLLRQKLQYINAANSSVLETLSIYEVHNLKLSSLELNKDLLIFLDNQNLIGNGFLKGFEEVIIHAKQKKLYLSKKELNKKAQHKLLNFNIGYNNHAVRITGLAIDNEFRKKGIEIGDHVIRINNVSTSDIHDECSFKSFESSLDIYGDDITLTVLRNGQEYNYSISKSMMYE